MSYLRSDWRVEVPFQVSSRRGLRVSKWIRWAVIPVAALLVIATILFAFQSQIERGIVAYRISSAGIFTPPTPTSGESQWLRRWRNARFYWDFSELRIA